MRLLFGLSSGIALVLAMLLRNPLLLVWRSTATPLVFGISTLALYALCIGPYRAPSRRRSVLRTLWSGALLIAAMQEGSFLLHKRAVLGAVDADARRIGAHLIVGYSNPKTMKTLIEKGLVGGIFISAHDVKGRGLVAIHTEIAALQALRRKAGLPLLIVSTDQEGGIVSRLSPPLTPLPSLADATADARTEDIESLAFAYGEQQGRELAGLGVNVNFAPLADLSSPAHRHHFDFRSQIGRRAIDTDPARVSPAIIGYAHGLEANGVYATLKHFPGLGRVTADTHIFPATLAASERELEASDWIPFCHGLRATQSLLMVGHATLSTVDAKLPASRSAKVIRGIVRQRWGHDGILVTDDLTMGAVVRQGLCSAGVDAINAGIDLLLVSYDTDQYYEIFDCLRQAKARGTLNIRLLDKSQRRLDRLLQTIDSFPIKESILTARGPDSTALTRVLSRTGLKAP